MMLLQSQGFEDVKSTEIQFLSGIFSLIHLHTGYSRCHGLWIVMVDPYRQPLSGW